jgi:hypothetical protein
MPDDVLHAMLRNSQRQQFRFTFTDGEELFADVLSDTHVDENDTVILLRVGAAADECAWQVELADIRALATPDGRTVYESNSPDRRPASD